MVSKSEKTAKMKTRHSEAWAPLLTRAWTPSNWSAHDGAFFLQILFCTLVHRSDRHFDSEPGTKRHNIWYPVKSYYRCCVWTGKLSQPHLGPGSDREGDERSMGENLSQYLLLQWNGSGNEGLVFLPHYQEAIKTFLVVFFFFKAAYSNRQQIF